MAKTATKVDPTFFEAAFAAAQENVSSLGEMWEKVAAGYNKAAEENDLPTISTSVCKLRAEEWKIETKLAFKRGRPATFGRTAKPVERDRLAQALVAVEKDGPLSSLSALWEEVATCYNGKFEKFEELDEEDRISWMTLKNRIEEWKLTYKTQASAHKGKPTLEVSKECLASAIAEAEKKGPLANLGLLWDKVVELYEVHVLAVQAKNPSDKSTTKISVATARNRTEEFDLDYKTQGGARGRRGGSPVVRPILEAALAKVEAKGARKNHSELWEMLSDEYNNSPLWSDATYKGQFREITPAVASARVKDWELKTLTQGRKVDPDRAANADERREDREKWAKPLIGGGVPQNARRGLRCIDVPSGECPSKLNEYTQEAVEKWCDRVAASGEELGILYAGSALRYWARRIVEDSDLEQVLRIIDAWNYQRFSAYAVEETETEADYEEQDEEDDSE